MATGSVVRRIEFLAALAVIANVHSAYGGDRLERAHAAGFLTTVERLCGLLPGPQIDAATDAAYEEAFATEDGPASFAEGSEKASRLYREQGHSFCTPFAVIYLADLVPWQLK